jgi:integrase
LAAHPRSGERERLPLTLRNVGQRFGPPKTKAGRRTVTVPAEIRDDLLSHLRDDTGGSLTALVFTGAKGGQLRRANFQRAFHWATTVRAVGLPGFHFDDLRHTATLWPQIRARASPS